MDEYTKDALVNRDEPIPVIQFEDSIDLSDEEYADAIIKHNDGSSRKAAMSGLKDKASNVKDKVKESKLSLQDRLLERYVSSVAFTAPYSQTMDGSLTFFRLLQKVIPVEDLSENRGDASTTASQSFVAKPSFSLPVMSSNFRRFNSRIGVVFVFQARMIRLMSWKVPSHTLSLLAVYTFVCLDPYLLTILPLVVLLLGVLVPAFLARHPVPSSYQIQSTLEYAPSGPAIDPATTVKPAKELSKDFFRNMRDLQNSMEDFSLVHDKLVSILAPPTNFSNEPLSSTIFLMLFVLSTVLFITSHLIPWRYIALVAGWFIIVGGHPAIEPTLTNFRKTQVKPQSKRAQSLLDSWIEKDIILDSAPEIREVEVFELQKKSYAGEWEPWLYSPDPWDLGSRARIAEEKVPGTRFFEDVACPNGWTWEEAKWSLDLWSREWVEERCISSVEVETEGERWVWDLVYEKEGVYGEELENLLGSSPARKGKNKTGPFQEHRSIGRRGEWRRRRWVRLVKRTGMK